MVECNIFAMGRSWGRGIFEKKSTYCINFHLFRNGFYPDLKNKKKKEAAHITFFCYDCVSQTITLDSCKF